VEIELHSAARAEQHMVDAVQIEKQRDAFEILAHRLVLDLGGFGDRLRKAAGAQQRAIGRRRARRPRPGKLDLERHGAVHASPERRLRAHPGQIEVARHVLALERRERNIVAALHSPRRPARRLCHRPFRLSPAMRAFVRALRHLAYSFLDAGAGAVFAAGAAFAAAVVPAGFRARHSTVAFLVAL